MLATLRKRPALSAWLLLLPSLFWLIVFFVVPMLIVVAYSFAERAATIGVVWHLNLENYARAFDPLYLKVFWRSAWIAAATTTLCFAFGYPLGYFIATRPERHRNAMLLALMVPFWTNFLIRTYAWLTILRTNTGLINVSMMGLGIIPGIIPKPLPLFGNNFAIILGLVYGWLPDMVLPCYAAIERLDKSLIEAAYDLYASPVRAFLRVIFPLTLPGVVAGSILVFIPSLGAYVTPDLLGGGRTVMIGNIITSQFLEARDWPFGSAISMTMMVMMLLGTLMYFRGTAREY